VRANLQRSPPSQPRLTSSEGVPYVDPGLIRGTPFGVTSAPVPPERVTYAVVRLSRASSSRVQR
jgi:hypothetical protein